MSLDGNASYDDDSASEPEGPIGIVSDWFLLSERSGGGPCAAAILVDFGRGRNRFDRPKNGFYALNRLDGGWFYLPELLKDYMGLTDEKMTKVDRSTFIAALIDWGKENDMGKLDSLLYGRTP